MLHIVLYEPEIPPNTGNIIRLCANTGFHLHLIEPLGFAMDDKKLRRAGLDYREWAEVEVHPSLQAFFAKVKPVASYACSTKGTTCYDQVQYQPGAALIFGPETRGLPAEVIAALPADHVVRLPMKGHSRSLNLSNSVAIFVFEAWRQMDFSGQGQ